MGRNTETYNRFFRENPRHEMKWETVQTEYLKWLEKLARKQIAYNDALQIVEARYSNICTDTGEECKHNCRGLCKERC